MFFIFIPLYYFWVIHPAIKYYAVPSGDITAVVQSPGGAA